MPCIRWRLMTRIPSNCTWTPTCITVVRSCAQTTTRRQLCKTTIWTNNTNSIISKLHSCNRGASTRAHPNRGCSSHCQGASHCNPTRWMPMRAFRMSLGPNDRAMSARWAVLTLIITQSLFQQLRRWVANICNRLQRSVACRSWPPISRKRRARAGTIRNWVNRTLNSHHKRCRAFPTLSREELTIKETSVSQKIFKVTRGGKISDLLSMIQISKIIVMSEVPAHSCPLEVPPIICAIQVTPLLLIDRFQKARCRLERMSWTVRDTHRAII